MAKGGSLEDMWLLPSIWKIDSWLRGGSRLKKWKNSLMCLGEKSEGGTRLEGKVGEAHKSGAYEICERRGVVLEEKKKAEVDNCHESNSGKQEPM